MTLGGSSSSGRRPGSRKASRPTSRRISLTRLTSTLVGTGTSTTARAQSRDRLITLHDRAVRHGDDLAVRRAHAGDPQGDVLDGAGRAGSPAPVTLIATTSPKPYCRSVMMKKPARTSPTIRCAPKPSADAEHGGRGDQAGDRHAQPVEHEERPRSQ